MKMLWIVDKVAPCPKCGVFGKKHSKKTRFFTDAHVRLEVTYSYHYCASCVKFFSTPRLLERFPVKGLKYTPELLTLAIDLWRGDNHLTLEKLSDKLFEVSGQRVPPSTLHDYLVRDSTEEIYRVGETFDLPGARYAERRGRAYPDVVGAAAGGVLQAEGRS